MRRYIIQLIGMIVVVATAFIVLKCEGNRQKEVKRLRENQVELTTEKQCDTINHVTQATTLTATGKKELKQLTTEQEKKAVKKIGAKLSRVDRITTLTSKTRIDTFIRLDTILLHDTIVPVFRYRDNWCDFAGELENGEIHFDLRMTDSVNIVAHRVPRKLLWGLIKFGTKSVKVDVYNSNPYNTIRTAKEIQVVK